MKFLIIEVSTNTRGKNVKMTSLLAAVAMGVVAVCNRECRGEGKENGTQFLSSRDTVGVYTGTTDADRVSADGIMRMLSDAGFATVPVTPDEAAVGNTISAGRFFLYVVPGDGRYPSTGMDALDKFLEGKGNLAVIGGPAFSRPMLKIDGEWNDLETYKSRVGKAEGWQDQDAYRRKISQPDHRWSLLSLENADKWGLSAPSSNGGLRLSTEAGGVTGRCLAYETKYIENWGTCGRTIPAGLFKPEHNALALWAKGDANTPAITLELDEKDGSRWIASLAIDQEWKYYEIPFTDFSYHASTAGRGGAGDCFKVQNAAWVSIGLAQQYVFVSSGPHRFWLDGLGSTRSSLGKFQFDIASRIQDIETIFPAYKIYALDNITGFSIEPNQAIAGTDIKLRPFSSCICPVARPKGAGYGKHSPWRWIPLVNASGKNGGRGTVASLLLNNGGKYPGSICASFGVGSLDAGMAEIFLDAARRMRDGIFLVEAGAECFSYYPGEPVKLGAKVANNGDKDALVTVHISIVSDGKEIWKGGKPIEIKVDATGSAEFEWTGASLDGRPLLVRTELVRDGRTIDSIGHEIGILPAKGTRPPADEFVTSRGGDFYCKGKKWYANGINYWPGYSVGISNNDNWTRWDPWLKGWFYIPDEVEKDLELLEGLGINMVSIQVKLNSTFSDTEILRPDLRNFLDFLRRCREHGIKVNAYLEHASSIHPPGFNEAYLASLIGGAELPNNPAIFAYDLAWEILYAWKSHGNGWIKDWNAWIIERYGTTDAALADWGYAPGHAGDMIALPKAEEMENDGPWRVFVAAHRRFLDDFSSRKIRKDVRIIRKYDPVHLISIRGTGGAQNATDCFLVGVAKHLDFLSPEGYAFPDTEDGFNAIGFQCRLIRSVCGRPVYFSELGKDIWDSKLRQTDKDKERCQAEYVEKFFKIADEAGINALAPWVFPGGYRVDEKSDFGMVNPDGSPRPAAEVMKKYASLFTALRTYPEPNEWMIIDRDENAGGYWNLAFNNGRDAYKKAVASGKHLGIKTTATGTDSANTPLLAVGNRPYNGSNPPKYLDGEFNCISIKDADGKWVAIYENGQAAQVAAGKPVIVKISAGNIGEAKWLAPALHPGKGGVFVSSRTGDLRFQEPILADTPYLKDAQTSEFVISKGLDKETSVVFELTALDRMWFGEKFRITLVPGPGPGW